MTSPRDLISSFCQVLEVKMLDKYDKGAEEHKGKWEDVNCLSEFMNEVIDILNYFLIDKAQNRLKGASSAVIKKTSPRKGSGLKRKRKHD